MARGEEMKKKIAAVVAVGLAATGLAACGSDAKIAASNISKAAEQFEVNRRIVFFNGITDKYLLEITGLCSVETAESALGGSLEVTCKTGPNSFKKHYLGLSDNVSYLVEQIEGISVSTYNYRVIFKPDVILPNIDLKTQVGK
jgi:predicted small secreted protein